MICNGWVVLGKSPLLSSELHIPWLPYRDCPEMVPLRDALFARSVIPNAMENFAQGAQRKAFLATVPTPPLRASRVLARYPEHFTEGWDLLALQNLGQKHQLELRNRVRQNDRISIWQEESIC